MVAPALTGFLTKLTPQSPPRELPRTTPTEGPNRVLGYVENMSGYYCRDCNAVKPLFASSESRSLAIPCLGTIPFDPELARHCDRGMSLEDLGDTPVGRALDHVAQQLLDSLP
jgi:hypothetical protein